MHYPERSDDHEAELVVLHSLDCTCRDPQCIRDREAAQDAELDLFWRTAEAVTRRKSLGYGVNPATPTARTS